MLNVSLATHTVSFSIREAEVGLSLSSVVSGVYTALYINDSRLYHHYYFCNFLHLVL